MPRVRKSHVAILLTGALCAGALTACKAGGRRKSALANWVDSPSPGKKDGEVIKIPKLGVKFEIPDTLYVYKDCGEASHAPDGPNKWVPVIICRSTGDQTFEFGDTPGEDDEDAWGDDPFAEEEAAEDGAEPLSITFFVTHKTRPLDERAVSWFENQYRQSGLEVDDISFQHDFQKKSGIYAKLRAIDGTTGNPTREIIQFLFPREDVVFIARMEYPFGETRSVDTDWKYILWNFDFTPVSE